MKKIIALALVCMLATPSFAWQSRITSSPAGIALLVVGGIILAPLAIVAGGTAGAVILAKNAVREHRSQQAHQEQAAMQALITSIVDAVEIQFAREKQLTQSSEWDTLLAFTQKAKKSTNVESIICAFKAHFFPTMREELTLTRLADWFAEYKTTSAVPPSFITDCQTHLKLSEPTARTLFAVLYRTVKKSGYDIAHAS